MTENGPAASPPNHLQDRAQDYVLEEFIIPFYHSQAEPGLDQINLISSLLIYVSPVFLIVCTVGNILSAIVLRRLYPGVLSTSLYVFVILLVDVLVMMSRCGVEWLRLLSNVNVREVVTSSSTVLCKIYPFVTGLTLHLGSWLTVAMAAETAWIYQRPLRLMRVCRLSRSRIVLVVLVVLLGLANTHCFWTYALGPAPLLPPPGAATTNTAEKSQAPPPPAVPSPINFCSSLIMDAHLYLTGRVRGGGGGSGGVGGDGVDGDIGKVILSGVELILADFLPFFIVFSCSVMLVTKRWRRRDQVRQIDNTWKACNIDSSTAHQLHTAFIVLCVLHSLLLFPNLTLKTFLFVTNDHVAGLGQQSVSLRPTTVLVKSVCYQLQYVYLSTKVFMLLAVSPAFRREFRALSVCAKFSQYSTPAAYANNTGGKQVTSASADDVTTDEPLLEHPASLNGRVRAVDAKSDDGQTTTSDALENGPSSIKIFSMTSV